MKLLAIVLLAVAVSALAPNQMLSDLRSKVRGRVAVASDPDFATVTKAYQPRHHLKPQAVVIPVDVDDVKAAMMIAQVHGTPFRVGSGWHNYEGYALADNGIVLSFRDPAWRQVTLESEGVVKVLAGAQLIDVHRATIPHGRGVVAGLCPSVGIVPFTLGGGYGSLSRKVGLSADNLISVDMVLANGTEITVNRRNTDLFWALRGAGGGNLGVVTALRLRSYPISKNMVMGETCWDFATNGREVLNWWAAMATSAETPRELSFSCRSHFGPLDQLESEEPQQICMQPFYLGTPEEGSAVVAAAFEQLPTPVSDTTRVHYWLDETEAEHAKIEKLYGLNVYTRSAFFETLPAEVTARLAEAVATAPTKGNCIIDFDHLGGAIADVEPTATAYVNRKAAVNLQIIATWAEGDINADEYMQWADNLFAAVQPFMSGAYVNYIDAALPAWRENYYGANYARLREIKRQVDPTNFFSSPQSIGAQ